MILPSSHHKKILKLAGIPLNIAPGKHGQTQLEVGRSEWRWEEVGGSGQRQVEAGRGGQRQAEMGRCGQGQFAYVNTQKERMNR